jgi:hypothetical protein
MAAAGLAVADAVAAAVGGDQGGVRIQQLKAQQAAMKADKKRVAKELKTAQSKRKRLMKAAAKLSFGDMAEVMAIQLAADRRREAAAAPGAGAAAAGAAAPPAAAAAAADADADADADSGSDADANADAAVAAAGAGAAEAAAAAADAPAAAAAVNGA